MRAVIVGCGAIGGHIAYSLYKYGLEVNIICRDKTFNKIKKNGLHVQVNKNKKILNKETIRVNKNFRIHKSTNQLLKEKIDFVFIAVKLYHYNNSLIKKIMTLIDKDTAIIPPCTNIPLWWINKFYSKKIKKKINKYFNVKNIIGMTMWLSSIKKGSDNIFVKHIQRGYPLKELDKKMISKAKILRNAFEFTSKSPKINNIYSEIFTKSLNALAFNMTALYYKQTNKKLKSNNSAIEMLNQIMIEGEKISNYLGIFHKQSYKERIKQTLSSSIHTMSMLSDYKCGKEIELKYLWRSFKLLSSLTKINMNYTNEVYKKLIKNL